MSNPVTNREAWIVTNNYDRPISLGKIYPRAISPDKSVDVLQYSTKEQVEQSKDIKLLLELRRIKISKQIDGVEIEVVDNTNVNTINPEQNSVGVDSGYSTSLNGLDLNMGDGSGSGGGTLNMEGGTINANYISLTGAIYANNGDSSVDFDASTGYLKDNGLIALAWDYTGISVPGNITLIGGRIQGYTGTQFADNAAALAGGLSVGEIYADPAGNLKVVI